MTTYVTIPNTDIDQDSPITQPLMTAIRDNPTAIGESDPSVPADLLPTVLLGTLTTTSGTTQTLSSLTLTNYKFLLAAIKGVGGSAVADFRFEGNTLINLSGNVRGLLWVDLSDGETSATLRNSGADTVNAGFDTTVTNASTSVSFSLASGNFDEGSIKVYGVK